jgi:hypothetical protein
MLSFQFNHSGPFRKRTPEAVVVAGNDRQNYTITHQNEISSKLNLLFSKNVLLSVRVPGKYAISTLLTTITCIENGSIYLGGFQNQLFNKDLLMQSALVVNGDYEGIALSFVLCELGSSFIDGSFNVKARLPESLEWVQRRNARRVKVPINIPVKIKYKNYDEYYNVADISVAGLSYIDQANGHYLAEIGGLHTDCNILLPDRSMYLACFEIVNNVTIPYQHTKQLNRIGCELKRPSYQLDTALQRLINQIDFFYQ